MHTHPQQPKTALITGANRGIGLAIAQGLASDRSIHVLAACRSAQKADLAAREIGHGASAVVIDLTDPQEAAQQAAAIVTKYGPVDILVNNAGMLVPGTGLEIALDDLSASFAVNTVSPFALIQVLGAKMKERGWGRIVNVSSGWGAFDQGVSGPAAYAISKAALNALTVSFAPVLGVNVKINAACPGWVRTKMGGQMANRSPEEGADTPVWLATLPDDGPTGGFYRDRHLIEW